MGRAENGWDIQTSTNGSVTTFTISRENTAVAETVKYRFVNLSAYAGEHYNVTKVNGTNSSALSGEFSFAAGDATSRTIQVTESAATTNAYKYQTGDKRSYKLEVTDVGGFYLTEKTRSWYTGIKVTSSEVFDIKHVTFQSSEYTANDDGYDKNGYKSVSSGSYCTSDTQAYLSFLNAQLCMTLSFDAKENDDAYEYLQLLVDNTSTCDNRSNCSNGDPGNISLSKYMAGFEMNTGNKDETYRSYTFPVLSAVNNEGATNPWGYGTKWPLSKQKFNGNRATDGRIIIPTGFSTLVLRLNASGTSGSDEWAVKNVMAHIQAVDTKAPTVLTYSVAPGKYAKGNTVYVTVAFGEIVTTSSAKLTSNWGDLSYVEGSGTNVLTFKRTIPDDASSNLNITGCSGIADLAGKAPSSVSTSNLCTLDDSYVYTITYDLDSGSADNPSTYTYETATFTLNNPTRLGYYFDGWTGSNGSTPQTNVTIANHSHGDRTYTANWTEAWTGSGTQGDPYTISSTKGLDLLAQYVNSGNTCKDLFFQLGDNITYARTTAWNDATSTENNYTAIGGEPNSQTDRYFNGTFDGQGYTVSGIRIYRSGKGYADNYQGLFGKIGSDGTVKNLTLSDARITGYLNSGGISGVIAGTIQNCHVSANVTIHAVNNETAYHGGIVGQIIGNAEGCTSSAKLTVKDGITGHNAFGGIAGRQGRGYFKYCLALGAVISSETYSGAIVGLEWAITHNVYYDCTVGSKTTGIGTRSGDSGALPGYIITCDSGVTASASGSAIASFAPDGLTAYEYGISYGGRTYYNSGTEITLSYSNLPDGESVIYKVNGTAIDGNSFTMPAQDVTVTATLLPVISYIDADGNEQSHMCTPITTSSTQYGNAANAEGWYCVNSDVNFTNNVTFNDQQVNIILCDGATMSGERYLHESYSVIEVNNGSLAIYGQTHGTGTLSLNCTEKGSAISANTNIDINGGTINAASRSGIGIKANNAIIIRRGNITANSLFSYGIKANTITLGCLTSSDRIWASSYNGTVVVAGGQTLTDGNSAHTYTGTLDDNQKAAIEEMTMMKALGDVSYIDENGLAQTCSEYKILSDGILSPTLYTIGKTGYDTWYVASGNYTFNTTQLNTQGHVHLILCDGANFTINGNYFGINAADDLTIYGQSQGTGTLTANVENASGKALYVSSGNLVVNGSVVSANGGEYGIYVNNGNLTASGGSINATGTTSGIHVGGNLTLGWTSTSDRITASSYSCTGTISIRDNQFFHNGTQFLGGIIGDLSKLNGKTLTPFAALSHNLTLVQGSKDGITAYWGTFYDSAASYALPKGASAYTMDEDYHLYRLGADGSVIPKGTAVVILGKEAAVTLTFLYEVPDVTDHAPGGNILVGQDVDAVINGICVLSKNASGAVGFYPLSGSALPAHKAGYVPKSLLDYHKEDGQQW